MDSYETGKLVGTGLLIALHIAVGVIMWVSLYRRWEYEEQKHMHPALYWSLFTIGALFTLSWAAGLFLVEQ